MAYSPTDNGLLNYQTAYMWYKLQPLSYLYHLLKTSMRAICLIHTIGQAYNEIEVLVEILCISLTLVLLQNDLHLFT